MSFRSPLVGVLLVLCSATLWGLSGGLIRVLDGYGVGPTRFVFLSYLLSFPILLAILAIAAPRYLRVSRRSVPAILVMGSFGGALAYFAFAQSIDLTTISLATLLTYTSPAWVAVMAWRFLGEPLGWRRALAIGAALIGCALVARAYEPDALQGSLVGIAFGVAAGFGLGLYSVVGKHVLETEHPLSVTLYGGAVGMLVLLPLQSTPLPTDLPSAAWPWLLAAALGPSLLGPIGLTLGLRVLDAGMVSLIMMWDIVVALVMAALLFDESLAFPQLVGALLVVASVLSLRPNSPTQERASGPAAALGLTAP